ncbi:hypothetical protein [Pectinatus brassicae]|nr:hypothetical protein [Pectinatus brassicae]
MMGKIAHNIYSFKYNITEFSNGVLSLASKCNVDISSVIKWYYVFLLILCPILIYCINKLGLFNFFKGKINVNININRIKISSMGFFIFVSLLLLNNLYFNVKYSMDMLGMTILLLLGLLASYCIGYKCKDKELYSKIYIAWLIAGTACNYLFMIIYNEFFNAYGYKSFYIVCYIILFAIIAYLYGVNSQNNKKILYIIFPLTIVSIIILIEIEVIYALRINNIFFSANILLIMTYILGFLLCIYRWKNFNNIKNKNGNIFVYATIGFLSQSHMRILGAVHNIDFFEGANHGIAIYDFINNNVIPILGNFDAHMLSSSLWGILYYLVTNDAIGALFIPYSYINSILIFMFLFFVLRRFITERETYILIFLLPALRIYTHTYFLGLGLILYFAYWIKSKKIYMADVIYALLFWCSFIYKLDIGASFGIAFIVCAVLYLIINKYYSRLKIFILCQLSVFFLMMLILYLISIHLNLNIGILYSNIMPLITSNQNWAYGVLGDKIHVLCVYFILPIIIMGLLFNKIKYTKKSVYEIWIIIYIYIAYILNVPRSIVRHNLMEHSIIGYGLAVLLFSLLCIDSQKKYKAIFLAVIFTLISYFMQINIQPYAFDCLKMVNNQIKILNNSKITYVFKPIEKDKILIKDLKGFFDNNLSDNETYLDFTNQTFLYAFLNRKNPVYINQSPALVNGEKGQENFLKEIKNKDIPFVLMPYIVKQEDRRYSCFFYLDSVLNTDRYYLITEYICKNYRPLCIIDDMIIWCKKDEFNTRINHIMNEKHVRLVNTYDYNKAEYYNHELGFIPFIWCNYDRKNSQNSKIIYDFEKHKIASNIYILNDNSIDENKGKYMILRVDSKIEGNCDLTIEKKNAKEKIKYNFRLVTGNHFYKIRCSSDILWYDKEKSVIKTNVGNMAQVEEFYLVNE